MTIGSGTQAAQTPNLRGNGLNYVETRMGSGFNIPFEIKRSGTSLASGQVVAKFGTSFTVRVTTGSLSQARTGDEFNVAGVALTVQFVSALTGTVTVQQLVVNIPFELVDDDQLRDGNDVPTPGQPERDALRRAMQDAYVEVLFDVGDNNGSVPFQRNVPAGNNPNVNTQDWDSSGLNTRDFWVAYILMIFQSDLNEDADPNAEGGPFGRTPPQTDGRGGSLIIYERHFEPGVVNSQAELEDTVVHEVGHVFEDGVPEPISVNARYIPQMIDEIRRTAKPDGRTSREVVR
jgi:hypothetical protein